MDIKEYCESLTKCLKLAHKIGIDTEAAIKCEGENECEDCPYNFDGERK